MEEEKIQKLRQMDRALEQQAGMIDPKRYIGDIVMKNQIERKCLNFRHGY